MSLVMVRSQISIHTLRVEGDLKIFIRSSYGFFISIHTLRVEGDKTLDNINHGFQISIHTLRVEGDAGERV